MPRTSARQRTLPTAPTKSSKINLRVSEEMRALIDAAAAAVGKTRTEFMLESARQHALDVVLDQRLFVLDSEQHGVLMKVLQDPPAPNTELRRLLSGPAPLGEVKPCPAPVSRALPRLQPSMT
jgi:uncharacterized protein (DUF1778 family)